MAAITATSIITESLGSLTLKIVALTAQATSDTYQYTAGAPIVAAWIDGGNVGSNVSYVASTGVFTILNTSGTAAQQLFILQRGA